jgi:hypoxanthine phosphoribosyltransferase
MGTPELEKDIERILFTETEIRAGVDRIGGEVRAYFRDDTCTVVSVLKGGCIFTADLIRRLSCPLSLTFAAVSSYRGGTAAGAPSLEYFPAEQEIQGHRILLVDDILDTGRTLEFLRAALFEHGASEVKTCVLLDKPARRAVNSEADFRGFVIEDVFVVGYGLDFAGRYRNLPYLATLRPEVYRQSIHTE